MSHRYKLSRLLAVAAGLALAVPLAGAAVLAQPAIAASVTTAWQNGSFALNPAGVVAESDIVLGAANTASSQSMPLGNGSLGVAAWAANGFTAQLNRSDTMPYRLSPGQVNIPGLSAMTSASNFSGTLDLYDGVLYETGGGMSMKAWVPAGKDELVVNVTGANPSTQQTATLNLWSGRSPSTAASGAIGSLAQTWVDNSQTGNSGQTFGAMAAITAGGQNVTASVVNSDPGEGDVQPELRRLVPGHHRVAQVDRRRPDVNRVEPDRRRHHRDDIIAARDAVVVVERLLGQQRPDPGDLVGRVGAVHGEPAHPVPV